MTKAAGRPQSPPRTPFESSLRKLMDKAGITSYSELSSKSNVSVSTVQYIACGARKPSVTTILKLSKALSCEPGKLLEKL